MSEGEEVSALDRFKLRGAFEEFTYRVKKNWKPCLIGAALAAGMGYLLMNPIGLKFVQWSYDTPFRVRGPVIPQEVAMVYMDEQSHQDLKQRYDGPWDRSLHARMLDVLTTNHVNCVVMDVVFSDAGPNPAADDQLAAAIKRNGKVILAADLRQAGYGTYGAANEKRFDKPFKPFFRAAEGRCASDFVYADNDGLVRRHNPSDADNDSFPSEGWAAAEMQNALVTQNDTNRTTPFYLNYYGPDGTIPGYSFSKVLEGSTNSNLAERSTLDVDPAVFSNKTVFVGARTFTKYTGDRKDEYPTPFSYLRPDHPYTGGVEIQATAFLNILRNERLLRVPVKIELPLIIGIGLLAGAGLTLLRPMTATIAAGLLAAVTAAVNYWMFIHWHTWFAWEIVVLAQLPLAWIFSVSINSVQLYVEKQKVEQSLALYLSPKLVKKFAKNPKLLKPGAEKQLLTILFSDIAGFTTISEGMDSDDLARAMNDYFQTAVHNCIHSTDGTVVKYIGDAIFAFWNAPDVQFDHSYRACEAALLFRDQPEQYMNKQELITRIGLHTGVANVGNFGSMTRVDYTALGENINLASRMEGLNKYLGTRVLITGETQKVAGPKLVTRFLGLFRLKGFERAVEVYELVDRIADEERTRELRDRFAKALAVFVIRDFTAAETAFQRVLELNREDGPTLFYLEQIHELLDEPPDEHWKGEITLKDK